MASTSSRRWRRGLPVAGLAALLVTSACAGAGGGGGDGGDGGGDGEATTITVATVANPQMQDIEELISNFEEENPDITVNFSVLPENELRDKVTQDIATQAGQYDVVTIGTYEVPIWADNGWITNLDDYVSEGDYDPDDLIPPVRQALTCRGQLYAVPFYGESSFLMYRKDLFDAAGLTMPEQPTWQEVAEFAAKLDDPDKKLAGICLRGLPGWGEVLAPLNTVILTFGGRWYDEDWNAHLTDPATKEAVQFYVDLVQNYGEPGAPERRLRRVPDRHGTGQRRDVGRRDGRRRRSRTPTPARWPGRWLRHAPVVEDRQSGWLWAWSLGNAGRLARRRTPPGNSCPGPRPRTT